MTDSLIKEKQKSSTARCPDASIQGLQVNVLKLSSVNRILHAKYDCRFSFAGMKAQIYDTVRLAGLSPGEILPEVPGQQSLEERQYDLSRMN